MNNVIASVLLFFDQNGGRDIIKHVNETKDEQSYPKSQDVCCLSFFKFRFHILNKFRSMTIKKKAIFIFFFNVSPLF